MAGLGSGLGRPGEGLNPLSKKKVIFFLGFQIFLNAKRSERSEGERWRQGSKRVDKMDQSLKVEKVEMMVSSPERRKSESPMVLKEEHDRGCNRFSSHLPCGDLPVGAGLLANDGG